MACRTARHFWWNMEILYKSKNFVIINKPVGIPSQSDISGDDDALSLTSKYLLENEDDGNLFLVHRLDRVVGGVIAFARNKRAASALSDIISSDGFVKEYVAVTEGIANGGALIDYLYKDTRLSRAVVVDKKRMGAKYAELSYEPLEKNDRHTLVKVRLSTGRFHQIRAQFSSRSLPLVGDKKYGSRDARAHAPALFSARLSFDCLGECIDVTALPDVATYPWCEFNFSEGK